MEAVEAAIIVGAWSLVAVIGLVLGTAAVMGVRARKRRRVEELVEARGDARRWHELLSGQMSMLGSAGGDEVAEQALADAARCLDLAARQIQAAKTVEQYAYARRSATEGLRYIGAARARLGLAAGPQGPPPLDADGRPMYEEAYRAAPASTKARDGDDRYEKTRGGAPAPGVPRLIRHQ